jgi:hypothetical protein
MKKEGIGSYFHFEEFQDKMSQKVELNLDYRLFYTGRHALLYILNEVERKQKINKIWFPSYYCQHTLGWIKKSYPNIYTYEVHPFEFNEALDVEGFAVKNDVVLVNNYWGLSSMAYHKTSASPVYIEDHSHGWLSTACLESKADYCFVSLRKSLPIPLGGMYWQPGAVVSATSDTFKKDPQFYEVWDLMLNAMKLKAAYIAGDNSLSTDSFLPLFYKVEEALNQHTHFAEILPQHIAQIKQMITLDILQIKDNHLKQLYKAIPDTPIFKIVQRDGFTAFGLDLLFKDKHHFNSCKHYLVAHAIYPSVLWPDNSLDYEWQYFLNIHVDYRYSSSDMKYIANILKQWLLENTIKENA